MLKVIKKPVNVLLHNLSNRKSRVYFRVDLMVIYFAEFDVGGRRDDLKDTDNDLDMQPAQYHPLFRR
jgi:hypothetical protein